MEPARARGGRASAWTIALVAMAISATVVSLGATSPRPTLAAAGGLDVEPESETVSAGIPVVITVGVSQTGSGGQGDGDVVRFFFLPGSPNDTPASPDLTCVLALGTCSVVYVPLANGTDLICATTETSMLPCFIAWDAAPGVSRADVVRRIVVNGTAPPPIATPTPAPPPPPPAQATPTATPAPTPPPPTTAPNAPPATTSPEGPSSSARAVSPMVDVASADVRPGELVTLRVSMLHADGSRASGSAADVVVGFYFLPGSPNEQTSRQNKPDLSCRTGADAACAVTYVARNLGLDTICAHTGPQGQWETVCAEPWDSGDLDDATDVVRRRVTASPPAAAPPPSESPHTPSAGPLPIDDVVVPPAPSNRGTTAPPPTPPAAASAAPAPAPAPETNAPAGEVGRFVWQVWSAIVEGVERAVRPEAAAKVATTFGFPLGLMVAVLLFLVVQDQIDRRDPKLRRAPRTIVDTMQRFRDEDDV